MIASELSPPAHDSGTDGSLRTSSARRSTRILLCTPYVEGVTQGPFFSYEQYVGDPLAAENYVIVRSPFVPRALTGKVRARGHFIWKFIALCAGYLQRVWDLLRAPMFDGVYISDWFVPFGPAWLSQLPSRFFRGSVLDICDRIYEPHQSDLGSIVSRLRPALVKRLAASVSEVVVVTRFMKEELLDVGRPINVISSSLDATKYTPGEKPDLGRTVVGWTGSPATSKYLKPLEAALIEARERADFDFLVIGDPGFRFDRFEASTLPWSAEEEVASLRLLDVGLYPLDDDDWVKGKGGMKAIQYMSLEIPVIASPVGVTPDLVIDGVTGYLVDSAAAWTEAIVRLVEDGALRRKLGANGRKIVESRYSTSALAPIYSDLFARVFRRG